MHVGAHVYLARTSTQGYHQHALVCAPASTASCLERVRYRWHRRAGVFLLLTLVSLLDFSHVVERGL